MASRELQYTAKRSSAHVRDTRHLITAGSLTFSLNPRERNEEEMPWKGDGCDHVAKLAEPIT